MQTPVVDRKIGRLRQHGLRLPAAAVGRDHLRADRAAVRRDADQQHLEPVIGRRARSLRSSDGGSFMIDDQDVDVAIVIEIAERHAAAGVRFGNGRGRPRSQQFFELAVARDCGRSRWAFYRGVRQLLLHFGIDHAGGEEEVGQAVVVEVHDAGAPADEARLHAEAGADA